MAWGCSVPEFLARVSSRDITELIAYDRVEPFGWTMDNWRMGMICATVANAVQGRKRTFYATDFFPRIRRKMTTQEMIRNLRSSVGNG